MEEKIISVHRVNFIRPTSTQQSSRSPFRHCVFAKHKIRRLRASARGYPLGSSLAPLERLQRRLSVGVMSSSLGSCRIGMGLVVMMDCLYYNRLYVFKQPPSLLYYGGILGSKKKSRLGERSVHLNQPDHCWFSPLLLRASALGDSYVPILQDRMLVLLSCLTPNPSSCVYLWSIYLCHQTGQLPGLFLLGSGASS